MRLLNEKPVTTLEGLLERLYCEWGSNKFGPVLHHLGPGQGTWVEENYEHRHMTTSSDHTDVDENVYLYARVNGYIIGEPVWGGRSTIHFVITRLGVDKYEQLRAERLVKEEAETEDKLLKG